MNYKSTRRLAAWLAAAIVTLTPKSSNASIIDYQATVASDVSRTAAAAGAPLLLPPPTSPSTDMEPTEAFDSDDNSNSSDGPPTAFIFDRLNWPIMLWTTVVGPPALHAAPKAGSAYSGLATATVGNANYIYVTDQQGQVHIFDNNFTDVTGTKFAGKFVDPNSTAGYTPSDIQNVNGNLYVTYTAPDSNGLGLAGGYVDEFDSSGNFVTRVASLGDSSSPMGTAVVDALNNSSASAAAVNAQAVPELPTVLLACVGLVAVASIRKVRA
jgi:hypothetical protein